MSDVEFGLPVIAAEFPHGLRCCECGCELREGDRYSERLLSLMVCGGDDCDAKPIVELVCVPCGFGGTT